MASKLEKYQIVKIVRERGVRETATIISLYAEEVEPRVMVATDSGVEIVDREDIES